ncbi:phosphotransferase [Corynebacterium neomassiliense]|uniref:phosphotransferase n=1 Tax=Corynebacterium neomassiliense TaxID=2079482 RepID=UPI0010316053|nr:phosphotransferase [Corynebacterium neomassiliense]
MLSTDTVLDRATHLLGRRFGGTPELTHPEDLGGSSDSLVLRAKVTPNPFLQQRSVVIKQLPALAEGTPPEAEANAAMIREVVAYQYTNTLPSENRPGPLLLAHDIDERIIVLSDAGTGESFADILVREDAAQRASALRKLGRALGRMQVATADGEESFATLNRRQYTRHGLPLGQVGERDVDVAALVTQGLDLLEGSGVEIPDAVVDFAREAGHRQQRSSLRAFTPFDLTPDNIMLSDQVVFLDFEWAGFRDIVFDVACVIAGFPHDISTPLLDEDEANEFIDAWASEVVSVWPEVRDHHQLTEALMTSLIGWTLMSLSLLYHGTLAVIAGADTPTDGARQLDRLPETHLADFATTVESVRRFATTAATSATGADAGRDGSDTLGRYTRVALFASSLLERLAELGAVPQTRSRLRSR